MKISPSFRRLAFSLLELMTVVVVGAIVIALAAYAMARMRVSALAVKNMGNHRAISAALLAYAAEHRGTLPYCYEAGNVSAGPFKGQTVTYTRTLAALGYISNPAVFFNPLAGKWYLGKAGISDPMSSSVQPWFYTNYAANRYGAMPYREGSYKPANLLSVSRDGNSSRLMLLRDIYHSSYDTPQQDFGGGIIWFYGNGSLPPPEKSYAGRIYASFADGHVEAFTIDDYKRQFDDQLSTGPPFFHKVYVLQQ